jgi:hypothetical protein
MTISMGAKPKCRDPVKQLACAVIFTALEDLGAAGTDKRQDARRFLFSTASDFRQARTEWFRLAEIPLDCIDKFKSFDAQSMKSRIRRVLAERRSMTA